MAGKHLITSIGTGNYQDVVYSIGDKEYRTPFPVVAVANCINLDGARGSILVTAKARQKWYDIVAKELKKAGILPEPVEIPEGRDEKEIISLFEAITGRVRDGEEIVLDVTFSLRHMPFIYLAALTYLVGLRGVSIQQIFYGAYELRNENDPAPILDITLLFRLIEWYQAFQMARETGDYSGVAMKLQKDVGHLFRRGVGEKSLSRAARATDKLTEAIAFGLPIEAGYHSDKLRQAIDELSESRGAAVADYLALDIFREQLETWVSKKIPGVKAKFRLTRCELKRQLGMAEWYARHGNLPRTLALLREWLVNAILLVCGTTDGWLKRPSRESAEAVLNGLREKAKAGLIPDKSQKELASLWGSIAERRNQYAHAGMREEWVSVSKEKVTDLIGRCRKLLPLTCLEGIVGKSGPRVLITSLGLSPGVLYSALTNVRPEQIVVITSSKARAKMGEAFQAARYERYEDFPPRIIELEDPHQGFHEIHGHLDRDLRGLLAGAREVIVNLTGGTTAMQYGAERLADEARRLGTPVRRIALIDRRPPEEQKNHPYVPAELLELDGKEEIVFGKDDSDEP